jgi:DNA polymerase
MKELSMDLETFSSVDIAKCGVYRYADAPDFEILLFGYSVDKGPVQVIDLASGEEVPDEILEALTDESIIKWSFNAEFERICLSRFLRDLGRSCNPYVDNHPLTKEPAMYLSPEGWHCSKVWSAYMGLPQSLKEVGRVLGLSAQKMDEGKDLIKFFCVPCKATKSNGGRTRNMPSDAPDKWRVFKAYNIRDVEVEMEIKDRLKNYPVPDSVWEEYAISEEINDNGVLVDKELIDHAIELDAISRKDLSDRLRSITGLENPNSVQQLKGWLSENGVDTDDLGKKNVKRLIDETDGKVKEALTLRLSLAKSSVKKYTAMENAVCSDGRVHGMFVFYGAGRTGRFTSKIVQLQNLPQNHLPDLAEARSLVKAGDFDSVSLLYNDIPDTLSQLIRTAFIPAPGKKFIVSDFSAIECRVLAWYAGEQWVLDTFANGGDIYCATAEKMFHVPVKKHGINGELRQKGKQATLSCGYGGSVGALKAMGALEAGMTEDELQPLVAAWRQANPHIVKFWWEVDHAAMRTVTLHSTEHVGPLTFSYKSGMMFITLPSGRKLAYVKPKIGTNQFGSDCITYEGIGTTKKWERLETYGPKLVENIVQATSRDILCFAMRTLRCCRIEMHIHDELIIEADPAMSQEELSKQMSRVPPWAPGLILSADGFESEFYKKD